MARHLQLLPALCVSVFIYAMTDDSSEPDIRRSLARAFDRAWDSYYRAGKLTVSRDIARTELARRLIQLSREGVQDEGKLAQAGLNHLRELTVRGGKQNS